MPEVDAEKTSLQPVRPDQGLAAWRLPADRRRRAGAEPQSPTTTSPRSSRRPSRRRTSCRASASRPTRCCRRASSPMPTRTATGSARITRRCRSTSRSAPVAPLPQGRPDDASCGSNTGNPDAYYEPNSFGGPVEDSRAPRSRRCGSRAMPTATTTAIGNDDYQPAARPVQPVRRRPEGAPVLQHRGGDGRHPA